MPTELFELLIEERISTYLLLMKIYPNVMGFRLILSGVKAILSDVSKKRNINNILFNNIAYSFELDKMNVDGAMRHAIELAYKRDGLKDFVKDYDFILKGERPTPRELLSALAIKVESDKDLSLQKK